MNHGTGILPVIVDVHWTGRPDHGQDARATKNHSRGRLCHKYSKAEETPLAVELEQELKGLIITELKVADMTPEQVKDDDPLFGEGLGLDSLDAVELVLILQKHYQIDIRDMEEAKLAFASPRALADYIRAHRPAS
jgi:acyl carrier protein